MTAAAATLLVELLTEELPPKALKRLGEAFAETLVAALRTRDFLAPDSEAKPYATPRRLAVSITRVRGASPDRTEAKRLMPSKVALDATGAVTGALLKRLEKEGFPPGSFGQPIAELVEERDGYVWFQQTLVGLPLAEGLQAALDETVKKLPIPKVMSYAGAAGYYNEQKFVRPAHRLVVLHGADVVAVRELGLDAGRMTAGHRFLSRRDLEIATADAYVPTLEAEGKVLPEFAVRRERIVAGLKAAAGGAKVIMPDALLDEVTALVEWPKVYTGGFNAAFLEVPHECLILTMQQNQKYFALEGKDGRLQNRFLLVSNLDAHDPEPIVHGNERVLRARLADAKFFYDQDRRQPLSARVPKLANVVYHSQLGSQLLRTYLIQDLAGRIAEAMGLNKQDAERAALLCKADLLTDMVVEFPELQGTMGRYYALEDRESTAVADAIQQHYLPRFAGDRLPEAGIPAVVALADKLVTLTWLFNIGLTPTGDKDPFGLRRQALGIVRILIERKVAVALAELFSYATAAILNETSIEQALIPLSSPTPGIKGTGYQVPQLRQDTVAKLEEFLYDRLRSYLDDAGFQNSEIEAVVSQRPTRLDLVVPRLEAVRVFRTLPEAQALAAANKRIGNILKSVAYDIPTSLDPYPGVAKEKAEKQLYDATLLLGEAVDAILDDTHDPDRFIEALTKLATIREDVDAFFDSVLVMTEDEHTRLNRLALLQRLHQLMNRVADISKLAA